MEACIRTCTKVDISTLACAVACRTLAYLALAEFPKRLLFSSLWGKK